MTELDPTALAEVTSEVVAAYDHLQPSELPNLIAAVHAAFGGFGKSPAMDAPVKLVPPVSTKRSITDDYLVSMEDGKRSKFLKRYLGTRGMTPADYRVK